MDAALYIMMCVVSCLAFTVCIVFYYSVSVFFFVVVVVPQENPSSLSDVIQLELSKIFECNLEETAFSFQFQFQTVLKNSLLVITLTMDQSSLASYIWCKYINK